MRTHYRSRISPVLEAMLVLFLLMLVACSSHEWEDACEMRSSDALLREMQCELPEYPGRIFTRKTWGRRVPWPAPPVAPAIVRGTATFPAQPFIQTLVDANIDTDGPPIVWGVQFNLTDWATNMQPFYYNGIVQAPSNFNTAGLIKAVARVQFGADGADSIAYVDINAGQSFSVIGHRVKIEAIDESIYTTPPPAGSNPFTVIGSAAPGVMLPSTATRTIITSTAAVYNPPGFALASNFPIPPFARALTIKRAMTGAGTNIIALLEDNTGTEVGRIALPDGADQVQPYMLPPEALFVVPTGIGAGNTCINYIFDLNFGAGGS